MCKLCKRVMDAAIVEVIDVIDVAEASREIVAGSADIEDKDRDGSDVCGDVEESTSRPGLFLQSSPSPKSVSSLPPPLPLPLLLW